MPYKPRGLTFDQFNVGDVYVCQGRTVTEADVVNFAGISGDYNPLHTNEEYGKTTPFGGRIAHGYITSAFMAATLGMLFHGTAVAYLEHGCRFTAPVRAGDTLTVVWTLTARESKPRHGGGVVVFKGTAHIQDGTQVAEADAKMLIQDRAPAAATDA